MPRRPPGVGHSRKHRSCGSRVCASGSRNGTGSDRQHRTVCGLRHAAKQASSDQSAFFLLVRVQFLRWPRRWERIFALGSFLDWVALPAPTPTTWHANEERGAALHCTALHCAALHVRSGKFMHRCCWMLAVGYWLLQSESPIEVHAQLVFFYAMMRPAVHWRGFSYPAPRGQTKIERDRERRLLASPGECLNIMSSISSLLPTRCSSSCQPCPSQVRLLQLPLVPYPISQVHRC